jgi:hypothetical protein
MSSGTADVSALEAKGRELFASMVEAVRLHGREYRPLPEISGPDGGYQTHLYDPNPVQFDRNVEMMLGAVGVPQDKYVGVETLNVPDCSQGNPPYRNFVHSEGRAILCWHNFAVADALGERRMFWSDLMAVSCSCAMAAQNAASLPPPGGATSRRPRCKMANLVAILRLTIVNQTTTHLIATFGPLVRPPDHLLVLRSDQTEFFALLGTPNGKGPARMPAAYPEMFGPTSPTFVGCWRSWKTSPRLPHHSRQPRPLCLARG